jgi:integral membrane protein (TIGR01906 family)
VRRAAVIVATAAVAIAVPGILIGNGLWLLMNDWYVHAEYARPGFPDDRYGFTKAERTELALVGLRSIHPKHGEGVQLLREARLPDGSDAFTEAEVEHMGDVRSLVGILLRFSLIGLAAILVLAVASRLGYARGFLPRALFFGSVFTLGAGAVLGVIMLIDFDWFFTQFHLALFEGWTWYFGYEDTLLRLYPDVFWSDFAIVLTALVFLQAVGLGAGTWWWRRRSRARTPEPLPSGDPQPSA